MLSFLLLLIVLYLSFRAGYDLHRASEATYPEDENILFWSVIPNAMLALALLLVSIGL